MNTQNLQNIISQGEGLTIEFKKSKAKLNRDLFESVCAFLNRCGGHIFLGVENDGAITGVEPNRVNKLITDFTNSCNDPDKLFPTIYLTPQIVTIEEKTLIYIYIPESSQVHNTAGKVFDRNSDGDYNVTRKSDQLATLYQRKQTEYSENRFYPYATMDDIRSDLIERARVLAKHESGGNHPWSQMNDEELLRSAQLFRRDLQSGKDGLTLAALLLFGTDEAILSALPHHRTDAILRRENLDRYDDRDDIRTNLLDSYDRLMAFVGKHLPDPFYLEGDQRINIRNRLFREPIANILIHREYANAYPAKMVIEENRVMFENANKPHGHGIIDPENFVPFPKNPVIAKVFREIGYVEELGSGVRNIYRYTPVYTKGASPQLIEDDVFRIIIPLTEQIADGVTDGVIDGVTDGVTAAIIKECIPDITEDARVKLSKLLNAILANAGKRNPDYQQLTQLGKEKTIERFLKQLRDAGLIEFRGDSPKIGGYYVTDAVRKRIE